jgi:hypothetical protein
VPYEEERSVFLGYCKFAKKSLKPKKEKKKKNKEKTKSYGLFRFAWCRSRGTEIVRLIAGGSDKGIIDRGSDKCSEMMSYKRYNFIFTG